MSTRFQDGLGRIVARDPNILDILHKNYLSSSHPVFAQAGMEIEFLQGEVQRLQGIVDSHGHQHIAKAPVAPKVKK